MEVHQVTHSEVTGAVFNEWKVAIVDGGLFIVFVVLFGASRPEPVTAG